jgi:Lon protease-like protein
MILHDDEIPLFPLSTVLFPGGLLPLRIFEARYLDMIGECLREQKGFGICAIKSGTEVGRAASCSAVGTLAMVEDFDRDQDGLLNIVARGERRFRVLHSRVEPNQLLRANVVWLDDSDDVPLPEQHQAMAEFLAQLLRRAGEPFTRMQPDLGSSAWVAGRLAELLPFALGDKQRLLELDAPLERLELIYGELLAEELSHHR